jgi:hypothetical protein
MKCAVCGLPFKDPDEGRVIHGHYNRDNERTKEVARHSRCVIATTNKAPDNSADDPYLEEHGPGPWYTDEPNYEPGQEG